MGCHPKPIDKLHDLSRWVGIPPTSYHIFFFESNDGKPHQPHPFLIHGCAINVGKSLWPAMVPWVDFPGMFDETGGQSMRTTTSSLWLCQNSY